MMGLRDQEKLAGDIRPLVVNVMNFSKAPDSQPTLLSFDDARTLFHEFGHALHGLLSDVTYPTISGTSVQTDFVELPSQLYEHARRPGSATLRPALPHRRPHADDLLARSPPAPSTRASPRSNMWPRRGRSRAASGDRAHGLRRHAFEQTALARIGMPAEIVMRHRPAHFAHVFSGGGYASAYCNYMWSEFSTPTFAAFEERVSSTRPPPGGCTTITRPAARAIRARSAASAPAH